MAYSGMGRGLGDAGPGDANASGKFGPVLDHAIVQQALPFGDNLLCAPFDSVICFTMTELDEAGELAFEAESEGSVGDQSGEPVRWHTNPVPLSDYFFG